VDLALLVKQDAQTGSTDSLSQTLPSISHNLNQTAAMYTVMGQTQPKPDLTSPIAVRAVYCCVRIVALLSIYITQ